MGRTLVPCPNCNKLYGGQGKVCWGCFVDQQTQKRIISETCPDCNGCKHRQSKLCQSCHLATIRRPENYVDRNCLNCGKQFNVHKCQIEVGWGKYCGRSCALLGSPPHCAIVRETVVCHTCGNSFEKYPSEIRKNMGDLHFCSPDCWYAHNRGKNHYGFVGGSPERQTFCSTIEWKKAFREVWRRDNRKCKECGIHIDDHDGKLHVHHIVSFVVEELRADLDNLVLLCDRCHWWVHSNSNENGRWIQDHVDFAQK